jgi:hypothetical protein
MPIDPMLDGSWLLCDDRSSIDRASVSDFTLMVQM